MKFQWDVVDDEAVSMIFGQTGLELERDLETMAQRAEQDGNKGDHDRWLQARREVAAEKQAAASRQAQIAAIEKWEARERELSALKS